jgi:hypothetical protein
MQRENDSLGLIERARQELRHLFGGGLAIEFVSGPFAGVRNLAQKIFLDVGLQFCRLPVVRANGIQTMIPRN